MTGPIVKAKNYLTMVTESTWGTFPGSPVYIHVPCESYGVKFNAVNRKAKSHTGLLQHKHNRNIKGMPAGGVPFYLYGWHPTGLTASPNESLAQWLMTWAFANQESLDLPSKTCIWAQGPNVANQRDLGMRVASAKLTGSEDAGILLQVELMGKDQDGQAVTTTAQTLPNDRNRLIEFLFEDSTFELNGSPIGVRSFEWSINRAMETAYLNAKRPQIMKATDYVETFSLTRPFEDDTWRDVLREMDATEESELVMTLKGLHMGTGAVDTAWTQGEFTFPLLSLVNPEAQADTLMWESLNFDVLKPDTADNGHTVVWSDEA